MRTIRITGTVVLASLLGLLFFQNCSAPVSFQEAAPIEQSSLSTNGIIINNGDEYTNNDLVLVQMEVNNAAEMYITNDPSCVSGGEWQPSTRQLTWKLAEKNSAAKVYAKFRSTYLKETVCYEDGIVHDDIAPTVTLAQAVAAKTNQAATEIKLVTADAGSGVAKLGCSSGDTCSQNTNVANNTDGNKSMSYYAIDRAGNRSTDLNVSWLVDRTPPVPSFVRHPAALTSALLADFEFSAQDTYSSNNTYRCQIDAGAFVACTKIYTFNNTEGAHTINLVAVDDLGNTSQPISYAWAVSRKVPRINITKSPGLYTNMKEGFEFTGEDQFMRPLAKFECQLNAGAWTLCTSPLDLQSVNIIQGANAFKVRGTDIDGIVSGDEERRWNYDTVSPMLNFEIKPDVFTKNDSEAVKVAVVEAQMIKEIEFILDGVTLSKNLANQITLLNLNAVDKLHKISVVATDMAGNKSTTINYDFWSDNTKPTLSFPGSPFPALLTPSANPAMSLATLAEDNIVDPGNLLTTYYYLQMLDVVGAVSETYTSYATPLSLANLKTGSYQLKFYVVDKAKNQSNYYVSNPFMIDLLPAVITFLSQPNSDIRPNTTQKISYLVQDVDSGLKPENITCRLSLNNAVVFDRVCAASDEFSMLVEQEGVYVFTITATDNVGNTAIKSVTWRSVELFEQKLHEFSISEQSNNKVDILFIVDNSRSMQEENQKAANAFDKFLDNLRVDASHAVDYRIAIRTTDNALVKSKGSLLPMGETNRRYIDKDTPNALALFQQTLTIHANGSGKEAGLVSVKNFIDRLLNPLEGDYEKSFYRDDAVLATVVISDSDEALYDGYQSAEAYLSDFYAPNTGLPNKTYIHHSIVILPNDQNCLSSGEAYGVTYVDVSRLTGGQSASLCNELYGDQLRDFATTIIARVSEQTLACAPIDQDRDGTIDMQITYTAANGSTGEVTNYSVLGNKVRFLSPLTIVGDYKINYYCVR